METINFNYSKFFHDVLEAPCFLSIGITTAVQSFGLMPI